MIAAVRMLAVLLLIAVTTAACQTTTGKSVGADIDDATITATVKTKLVADHATNLTRVDVDTNNGTVYLNGTVETAEQKSKAERLAWQAKGVKSVVNNLQIQTR